MADLKPPGAGISLDQLLEANRAHFDRILGARLREARELGNGQPRELGDVAPAELPSPEPGNGEESVSTRREPLRPSGRAMPEDAPSHAPAPVSGATAPKRKTRSEGDLDPITLDLIENALRNARHEMDAVLFRSAMSPVIREQHDEFPMITDAAGRMIVGQFGSYVSEMLAEQAFELEPGDIILQSDPYLCGGAISHINDWMVLIPIFFEGELVGFSSMFGHMMDVGGPVPCSMPTAATSIFGEGIRIPPIKIYARGEPNEAAMRILMNNSRTPEMNYSDLMAIIAGSRTGEQRVIEMCERFGVETYKRACEALLKRTERAMRALIVKNLPEEPQSFEDFVDDDGLGNGPFKLKLTLWREGEHAFFDWTGTSPQAPGPINFYLHEGMFKMFIGVYMIMVFDPQILFNDGFYDLIHVTLPKGSLLHPDFPAALGSRTHALARQFDVLGGALSQERAGDGDRGRATGRAPTSSTPGWTARAGPSSSWRSSTAGFPAVRLETAWTDTRGGRSSRTFPRSTSRATTRCSSKATRAGRIPAARVSTGAATEWRRSISCWSRGRSRSTTTATSPSPGGSSAASRAGCPRSGWSGRTARASASGPRSTTCA